MRALELGGQLLKAIEGVGVVGVRPGLSQPSAHPGPAEATEARVPGVPGMLFLAQWQGTLTVWSFTREAPIEDMVRRNLRQLLGTR